MIKDFITRLTWLVYLQQNTKDRYKTTSGPFVPALTNGPHVSYATWVTHMQFSTYSRIHYHPL